MIHGLLAFSASLVLLVPSSARAAPQAPDLEGAIDLSIHRLRESLRGAS